MDKYYLAVNDYRTSTSNGFGNTWRVRWVPTKADRDRILRQGLPVKDQEYILDDGKRSPFFSTNGLRALTPAERSAVRRDPDMAERLDD